MLVFVTIASVFYPLGGIGMGGRTGPAGKTGWTRGIMRLVVVVALSAGIIRAARMGVGWVRVQQALEEDLVGRLRPLTSALQLDPGNLMAARNLGVTYLWLSRERAEARLTYGRKALATARAALAGTPNDAGLLEIEGVALWRTGHGAEGRAVLARVKTLQPWRK